MILYADDDPGWRELMAVWLASKGWPVCICSSGTEALARAPQVKPKCVILDYDIGDMKGSAVCAALRGLPGMARVPVVILTSHSGDMLQAVKEGSPDHFVVKSRSPDELFLVLEDLLGSRGR